MSNNNRQTDHIMDHKLSPYLLPPDVSPAGLHTGTGGIKHYVLSNGDNNTYWFNNPNEQTQ